MIGNVSRYIICTQFGTNLNDDMISSFVSPILQWFTDNNALQEENIFRLSGNAHAVESLVDRLSSGESVELTLGDDEITTRVHDVASLLKYFLRKLPEPIVTHDCFAMFLAVDSLPEQEHEARIDLLRRLVAYLPDTNQRLLAMLCRFLHRVAQHSAQNKMSAVSLGMVFAPALILDLQNRRDQVSELVKEAKAAQNVIALLINNHGTVFDGVLDIQKSVEGYQERVQSNESVEGMDGTAVSKECTNNREEFPALQLYEPCATRDALLDCNFDSREANDVATKIKRLSMMLKHELESLDMDNESNMAVKEEISTIHLANSNTLQTDSDFAKLHEAVRPARNNSST